MLDDRENDQARGDSTVASRQVVLAIDPTSPRNPTVGVNMWFQAVSVPVGKFVG